MKIKALCVALFCLFPFSARAQFTPLCDDGGGGYKACVGSLKLNHLPLIPTDFGGTGVKSAIDGRYFAGSSDGTPRFKLLERKHIPGIDFDFSKMPAPIIEVTKDVGTGPQMIARFPGDAGTFNRWYVSQRGMFFTFNCVTSDGVTCFKDSTAVPSAVWEMGNGSVLRWALDTQTGISSWRTDNPQRAMEWTGSRPYWAAELGNNGSITAWAGGTVRGARVGDVVYFPVQWPSRLKKVPTKFMISITKTVGTSGVASISNADDAGAVLSVEVTSPDAAGDFSFVGQVRASN